MDGCLSASGVYEPVNDVSLTTVNLVVLGAFAVVFALFGAGYVRARGQARGDPR